MIEAQVAIEPAVSGAEALAGMLRALGVRRAFGIVGGAIARFCDGLTRHRIEVIHAQHETGAAFMASEAYFASRQPSVLFTTTGPGASNSITGLLSAVWDGAKVIAVTGATDLDGRGRRAFQETLPAAMDLTPWLGATPGYLSQTIDAATQLSQVGHKLALGLARPGGFVANLSFTPGAQASSFAPSVSVPRLPSQRTGASSWLLREVHRRLRSGPFVIWVGFGARHCGPAILEFAERAGAMVMCSPRAKGVFPESHPQYLGVTGMFGSHVKPFDYFREQRPSHVLVLGSRLSESTSGFDLELAPREAFIHVDLDPSVFGTAYPTVEILGVQAEIGGLVETLASLWPGRGTRARRVAGPQVVIETGADPVHPRALMAAIQRVVVDRSTATILADAGNSFAWANLELRFDEPGRYRVSSGFASMTSAACGVVGTALASSASAVAIVGDGAMLMNNELSTGVRLGVDSKWIVLNDSSYGMVRHGMNAVGMMPTATRIASTDFARYAESLGATGLRVTHVDELDGVLERMMDTPGPVVVDVRIDPQPVPPFGRRNRALEQSWNAAP